LPGLLSLIVFFYIPAVFAIYCSFLEWDGHHLLFIGLDNFRDLLHDPVLKDAFKNLFIFMSLCLLLGLAMPLAIAEMVFNLHSAKWKRFFQISFLIPALVPGVVIMLIWGFIYDPYLGPLNAFLVKVGFDRMDFLWLANPKIAIYCLIFIGFPWVGGTSVLILLAGLNTIPTSVLDYCRLEGLGGFKRFVHIDIHFILGQVRLLAIIGFIGLMQSFGLQLILTGGGPGTSTMVPGYSMYLNAFSYDRLGYASAIGLVLAIIILGFTILNLRYIKAKF
jgi:ABC-type sugar transport system permease subunit